METIKKDNLSEISRQYGVGVNVLSKWRTDLMEEAIAYLRPVQTKK